MARLRGRKRRRKRRKLTADERRIRKIKRDHRKEIRSIFSAIGFTRLSGASDREFSYQGGTTDFDDIFAYENIVALVEYTTANESHVSDHLRSKKITYDKIAKDPISFVEFLDAEFAGFRSLRGKKYTASQMRTLIVYCSFNTLNSDLKREVRSAKYLDFQISKYFKAVTASIKRSARFEFFNFLGLRHDEIGENILSPSTISNTGYSGSILPEEHSHFRKGYKVVSFYVDPEALLSRCYVLRKDGWEETGNLYQRMISKTKIEAIRSYLLREKRVFINNIVVTLPSTTKLFDSEDNLLNPTSITRTSPVKIQLPTEYNSVGLVDGQHRVFSYYESGGKEPEIARLRKQQNLLATGIIYPGSASTTDRMKFEATLFLEINANQTNAKSDVKQAIGLLLHPFSPESIAKQVVNRLNERGPLANQFERFFFEKAKLKTTTVVSYGIKPLVRIGTGSGDSLFELWSHARKRRLEKQEDAKLLEQYVDYCVSQINQFIGAVRIGIPPEAWTADKKKGGLLTTTNINGFIVCLRRIVAKGRVHRFEYYRSRLGDISKFQFSQYRSSQYGRMGEDMYSRYFS